MTETTTATHPRQTTAWGKIPADFKHKMEDGTKMVLVLTEQGTSLVPWLGTR